MDNLVLELVASYEQRISTVESLVNGTGDTTANSEEAFEYLCRTQNEGEQLIARLRELLAQNRSLRRKDFDNLVVHTLGTIQESKLAIEEERKQIRGRLTAYLRRQRQLMSCLRERLGNYVSGDCSPDKLQVSIDDIKKDYNDEGHQIFTDLRNFQVKVSAFCREQQLLNDKIRRLLERGEHLRVVDLRQLKAIRTQEKRKDEREMRRQDIERLLARFRDERKDTAPRLETK